MKRIIAGAVGLAVMLGGLLDGRAARAGVYTDALDDCIAHATTPEDQAVLVQWMFAAFSQNPSVKPLGAVSEAQRDALNRKAAAMTQRLVLTDCHRQAVAALKYEGPTALGEGFQVMGQLGTRGLMTDPSLVAGIQAYGKYMDWGKFGDLAKEAGIPVPPIPNAPN